ncbi:MAG: sirohydrochlorin cobaltochelatase [Desulfotalea sp.]
MANIIKTPIIFTAFGTTSKALASYESLTSRLRPYFPHTPFFWSYSSRQVAKVLRKEKGMEVKEVSEILANLHSQGCKEAIVQSLHLFPGYEFHKIARQAKQAELPCRIGKPLLTSPEDYDDIIKIILKDLPRNEKTAILLVGHGTDHPCWTSFHSLAVIASKIDPAIYVGTVEKQPNCDHIVEEIALAGFTEVLMVPLFMVAGLHYKRDMIGSENSWQTRLEERGLKVSCLEDGLALYEGIENLIAQHIIASNII